MLFKPKNDIEAIDLVLKDMFKEGVPYWFDAKIVRDLFDESYYHEINRVLRKMGKLDLIGKSTQIDPHRPKQTNPHRPFQIDPLIPA